MYTDGMTDTLDRDKLIRVLQDRIAELTYHDRQGANALSQLLREIHEGTYAIRVAELPPLPDREADGSGRPVPEVFVDMLIGGQKPVHDLVEQLPVGEVAAARTILWRRRHEAEQQVGQLEKLTVVFRDALEETLRADEPSNEDESFDDYEARIERINAGGITPEQASDFLKRTTF